MLDNTMAVFKCPHCGREFSIQKYDFVNADADEDLRDRCVTGDIFRECCPHCKEEFMVTYPMLYFDPSHRFVIYLSEKELPKEMEALKKEIAKSGFTLRRCSTLSEFTEKIQILEDGIDDVLVELAKYDCFIEFIDNQMAKPEEITSIKYERADNGVIKINVHAGDKGRSFTIPLNMMEEEMNANKERYEVNNEDWPLINSDYIVSLFKDSSGQA